MCGRYVSPTQAEMERYWQLTDAQIRNPLGQLCNASPTAIVPMLRLCENGTLEQVAARWGLIPFWWKEAKPPRNTFNARSEEAATKPMWRIPASKARCLVPAMGWYEWKEVERFDPTTGEVTKAKQPFFMRRPDRQPIAFAGLMSRRTAEGDKTEFTCSILTRDAIGPAAQIHTRMPIALPKDAEGAWLYRELTDAAVAIEFAREQAVTEFVHHLVNPRVNNAQNEGADLIEPFDNPA
jgi:putative SOS response-associated peptidase YedK